MSDQAEPRESTRPNFPQMEEEIAVFWDKKKIFERSIEERPETKGFVFYDGPPFATGLPHPGHLLQSTLKDAVPRYWTMQGYRVPRRWGWDCHGLPMENLIEKELKLNSRRDIVEYGIDKFNDACRTAVMRYEKDWGRYVHRFGRWVDFEHSYKTMDNDYIESVWWVFAELYKKSLIYKDQRVSFYCPRCATPLSNFEIAMDNSYEDKDEPAVTVKFKLTNEDNTFFIAWTTTPWSIPGIVALAVHPDLMYVKVRLEETNEVLIFVETRMNEVLKNYYPLKENGHAPFEILARFPGRDLVGQTYEPLYTFASLDKPAHRVVAMEYVSGDDGTGIVTTAPAYGEDDFRAAKLNDLSIPLTVDDEGCQRAEMGAFAGMPIHASSPAIIEDLKQRGLLYREERIVHSVPVCWRCNSQLLYKAQPAWFVNVTKLKPKLLETAKKINWHPEHFKTGRFGKGLETAPDWCISRPRFWGAPLPVWECDGCDERVIFSSIEELKAKVPGLDVGAGFDLHRPFIDAPTFACACGGTMKRTPDVFDCWFESGSMPYASQHYPFENRKWFDANFPADFIAEAQDQTRGWFYALHVLATALFNKPAFTNVIVTGLIMAEDGKKMSKKLKNYADPQEIMDTLGSDALRFYLLSSPVVRAEQVNFSMKDCQMVQRAVIGTLWNVRAFYLTYAEQETIELKKPRSSHVLDRWIFARLMEVEKGVTLAMNGYDPVEATRLLRPFIEDLSTWWLRRSRERMKGEDAYDRLDALCTLKEVLLEFSVLLAPFTPFFAERLYQDVGGMKMSVHLERWPKADERLIDEGLLRDMQWVREVVTAGLEMRAKTKLPVRQALASLTIRFRDASEAAHIERRKEFLELVREELNVEEVRVAGGQSEVEEPLRWDVILDTQLTPELKKKGLLRMLVRQLMNLRKDAGLTPNDRIAAGIALTDIGLRDTIENMREMISKELKADQIDVDEELGENFSHTVQVDIEGMNVKIGLRKI